MDIGENFKQKLKKNLLPLQTLIKVAKQKKIDKHMKKIGYSNQKNKKYYVINESNKKIHFGDVNYEDFLVHHDEVRRDKYRARHKSDNIRDPNFAGY